LAVTIEIGFCLLTLNRDFSKQAEKSLKSGSSSAVIVQASSAVTLNEASKQALIL
jgi:hypothetical protein